MKINNALIKVENVSFAYNTSTVLTDVNFQIYKNDSVCIVGPNGGGKSTLLKLLLGLIKPANGKISIFGGKPVKARTRIGYMPQYLHFDQAFPVNVLDVVLMGRLGISLTGFYSRHDKRSAAKAMEKMGVAELAQNNFSELSGGQRQRILIARALASTPELLILDEPTANVDPVAEQQIGEILKDLAKTITVITVSHDLGFVSRLVNRVLCVNKFVKIHPTSEITGEIIQDIYGADIKMVRHDHCCSEQGHSHD
ncbi:MAG: ABC transporter [Desulfobacteraceae bacterium 4572_19]|nr:MAG: ABC transporter [Desulfobacteraceae bacterium 4572_19]